MITPADGSTIRDFRRYLDLASKYGGEPLRKQVKIEYYRLAYSIEDRREFLRVRETD